MIEGAGGRTLEVRCDVSRADDVKAALDKTIEAFGRLDYAFNNAGVEQPIKPAVEITDEEWDRIVDIDLRGVADVRGCYGFAVVTLDTFAALHEHDHQLAAYCATCERWAVLNLARLIADGRGDYSSVASRAVATAAGRAAGNCGRRS